MDLTLGKRAGIPLGVAELKYIASMQRIYPAGKQTLEEEQRDVGRAKAGDTKARDRLTAANVFTIVKVVHPYLERGALRFLRSLEPYDLLLEGQIGFYDAIEQYEDMGMRLAAYAPYRIRDAVTSAFERALPLSSDRETTLRRRISRLVRAEHALSQRLKRRPTERELLSESEGPQAGRTLAWQVTKHLVDGTIPVEFGSPGVSPSEEEQAMLAEHRLFMQEISEALLTLSHKEEYVLRKRYETPPVRREEIARALGTSAGYVDRLRQSGFAKLRAALLDRFGETFDDHFVGFKD